MTTPTDPTDASTATAPAADADPVASNPPPPADPTTADPTTEDAATEDAATEERPRSRGRWLFVLAIVIAVVGILGARITVPYVIFSPGDATPIDDYLRISGARTYRHHGGFLLLTVRVSNGRPNVWRFVQASLDDDSKVIGEDQYLGTTPRRKVNARDVQEMEDSQHAAAIAALTKLGYQVKESGQGALVAAVVEGSPAVAAGLKPGDVITAIDGQQIQLADQVGPIVQNSPVGTTFILTVRRDGKERQVSITSGSAPAGPIKGKPYFGISSMTDHRKVEYPVDVKIDAGDVRGPSGGLAFALSIIDDLTPGNLSGGKKVAVTGEIHDDGTVSEVGGVPQKAVAAREAGATLMIVPASEVRAARSKAGSMPVVGVKTLDDALRVLRAHGGAAIAPRSA
jgi:PDZ domain-containing protein